jgi:hypothetical protein
MSEKQSSDPADSPVVVRNSTVDAVVAVIVFAAAVVVMIEARRLGAGWTSDGPGSGYFPFYIALILGVSSLGIFYRALFGKSRDAKPFVNRVQLVRVLSVVVPALVYVLCCVFLGLYVASAIYIALFMIVLGKYPPVKSVLLASIVCASLFLLFEVWFKVPLYKGMLEPLRFLGY